MNADIIKKRKGCKRERKRIQMTYLVIVQLLVDCSLLGTISEQVNCCFNEQFGLIGKH